jgi:hypothetical protein
LGYDISHHVIFFKNQYLFPIYVASMSEIPILIYFDDLPSIPERLKPRIVNERCCLTSSLIEFGPLSKPI